MEVGKTISDNSAGGKRGGDATATATAKRGPSAKSGLQDDDPDRIVSVPPF
jgi:hypothetical protein